MAPLLSVACLLVLVTVSMQFAGGALVYSLDDPYIHLALARTIQGGSYGINPGEWASPSSSIAWPFVLALVPARWAEWGPLLINAVLCVWSVHLLAQSLKGSAMPPWAQALCAVGLAFALNLFGLVMSGMEHVLQVALVIFVAQRLSIQCLDARFYAALALMPLVRYECMAITLPVATHLWFTREKGRPAAAVLVALGGMAGFSAFLHAKGLPLMPSSVLAKSADRSMTVNVLSEPILFAMLAWLAYFHRQKPWQWLLWLAVPVAGFMVLGRVDGFGRYEVFIVAWLLVFLLQSVQQIGFSRSPGDKPPRRAALASGLMCMAIVLSFPGLWRCTVYTPMASRNIAQQQAVMARLAHDLGRPVAVNDLGMVALRSGQYVLDLWGLGSIDALRARLAGHADGAWMDEVMQRKGVDHAFIYEAWFPQRPASWIKVGELVLDGRQMTAGGARVALLARTPEAAQALRSVVLRLSGEAALARLIQLAPAGQHLAQVPGAI